MLQTKDMHVQGPQVNQFNNISPQAIPRSSFKRDFTRRQTFDQDYIVPVFVDEILPGDDINLKMTSFCRMSTPIKPLMDNLYLDSFFFFIPNRLVWDNWEKFQGQQTNPGDSVAYNIPTLNHAVAPISTTGFTVGSVYDYLGLPIGVTDLRGISSLFNRAYALCWNEWFRDENLQNSLTISTGDGPDDPATYSLYKRNKRKDYITSCLPWPQKGTAVSASLAGAAPITGLYKLNQTYVNSPTTVYATGGTAGVTANYLAAFDGGSGTSTWFGQEDPTNPGFPGIYADLSGATGITINALRQAALYQQILELDARGGTRYVESIYSRFGVVSPDFRLQRPELIGQGSTRINIYSVPQTTPTSGGSTPQGNLAAFGTAVVSGGHGCRYSATEHGMILGFVNVRADLTYQQGVPKMFTRSTRLDFYEPLLNGLGEQSVLLGELYAQGGLTDLTVFGYQERFAEYRFKNSEICGLFRSTAPSSIDIWHLSQEFGSAPALNTAFITEAVPMARVLAVPSEPSFLMDTAFSYTHVRPMPIRSNPGIDRL